MAEARLAKKRRIEEVQREHPEWPEQRAREFVDREHVERRKEAAKARRAAAAEAVRRAAAESDDDDDDDIFSQ